MTRNEAIDLLDNLIGMVEDNHESDYDTALKMAKKALEFIDKIEPMFGDMLDIPKASVKPQEPKTGHWIEDTNGTYTDNHDTWECSECGNAQILLEGTPKDNDYNYCPNCGARMVEPQESEEV